MVRGFPAERVQDVGRTPDRPCKLEFEPRHADGLPRWRSTSATVQRQCSGELSVLIKHVQLEQSKALDDGLILQKTPLVAFDVNPGTLSSNVSLLYRPVASVCCEINVQVPPRGGSGTEDLGPVIDKASLQHTGSSTTTTLRCYRPGRDSCRLTLDHLMSYNDRLAIGGELLYEWYRNTSNAQIALAAR